MRKRSDYIAPDSPGTTTTREAHCMDRMPGHQEFSHISPALIVSSANKRGGVVKVHGFNSGCNAQPATFDLQAFQLIRDTQNVNFNRYLAKQQGQGVN